MSGFVQIQTTVESAEQARSLAEQLVEKRVVACVQVVGPVESIYRWRGAIEHSQELLLLAKTTADCAERAMAAIEELHPYEVPEILVLPVQSGGSSYLEWVADETGSP